MSSPESLASWDRASLSWRTSQLCLLEGSTQYSERWPTSGTMRNGQLYARPTWVPRTDVSGSSSWPTPRSCSAMAAEFTDEAIAKLGDRFPNLETITASWATPKASDGQGGRTTLTKGGGNAHFDLQVRTWATPRAEDGERGQGSKFDGLSEDVTAWATPTTRDHEDTGDLSNSMVRQDGTQRDDTVPRQAYTWAGPTPPPSEAQTAPSDSSPPKPRRRGLNPRFGLWLMGFPTTWLDVED